MLGQSEIPTEVRNQLGNFFIVASKGTSDHMSEGDEILVGPLLTAVEAENLVSVATVIYTAFLPDDSTISAVGIARIPDSDYSGRFNAFFGLDPEGKEIKPEDYESTLLAIRGGLAAGTPNLKWLRSLPAEAQAVARRDIALAMQGFNRSRHIESLLDGLSSDDPQKRESTLHLLELTIASGGSIPQHVLRDMFKVELMKRWGMRE